MTERADDIGDWIEAEATGGGLAVLAWGLGSVVALVLAFASWQYAPGTSASIARTDIGGPDPSEITGSIATNDEGRSSIPPSRTFGMGRLAPLPLAGDESPATSRDIEQLRAEIAEIRRRITQIGMAGEGVARRIDGIEERVANAARPTEPPPAVAPVPTPDTAAAPVTPLAQGMVPDRPRIAERLPIPLPRPVVDPSVAPPTATFDADGPATTGAVPKSARLPEKAAAADAKAEAAPAAQDRPVKPATPDTGAAVDQLPQSPSDSTPARSAHLVGSGPTVTAARPVVSAEPPAPGAAPAATGVGPAAIDLGGFRTLASLRRAWSDTTVRHTSLTKDLAPLARLRETDTGMEARLLAGPFPDQVEAAKACLRLKAVGATCAVTNYGGQSVLGLR